MNGRIWPESDLQWLRELYPSRASADVAKALGVGLNRVNAMASKLGLKKTAAYIKAECRLKKGNKIGRDWQFPKGHVPANKGLRRPGWHAGRMQQTQFRKGERSGIAAKNWVPIGTILPDSDGYLRIKVREAVFGKEPTGWGNPEAWPQYHRYIWEQHHGPIPPKHIVTFRDRCKSNCVIENLELISRAENARRNRMWTQLPRELAEVIQLNGALKRKIRRLNGEKQTGGSAGPSLRDARSAEGC